MTTQLQCGGADILGGRIVLPRVGAWYADLRLATTTVPTAATSITSDTGLQLKGTVAFGGVWQGHVDVRIEAGGNGFDRVIQSTFYRNPTTRIVLNDAVRDASEQLAGSISADILNTTLPAWTRRKATLGSVLGDIVRFACPTDTRWRTLQDGTVWVGSDTYTNTVPQDTHFELMDFAPSEQVVTIGCDFPIQALIPGVLFQFSPDLPAGRVSQVEHSIQPGSTVTTLWLDTDSGDRVWNPLARSMGQVLAQQRYLAVFTGKIVAENGDTYDVQLDDPTQLVGLSGTPRMPNLTQLPIRSFGPNVKVVPAVNARVLVGFEDGSPTSPVIVGFEDGSADGSYEIGTSPQFVALANLVNSRLADIRTWANSHTHIAGALVAGATPVTGNSGNTSTPLGALADVSCAKLKTE